MIKSLDYVVLTTRAPDQCVAFYTRVLGMQLERFGEGRIALKSSSRRKKQQKGVIHSRHRGHRGKTNSQNNNR